MNTIQIAFATLLLLTGTIGTCCQVIATWLNQLGGPRESHVAALLVGMAGTTPQDIYIMDRRLNALAATTLTSYGSALLFASIVAGLIVSFPHLWIAGLLLWGAVLAISTVLIVRSSYLKALRLRQSQEALFESLPIDGTQQIIDGRVCETAAYRAGILSNKPDLETKVSHLRGIKRFGFLVRNISNAYIREKNKA